MRRLADRYTLIAPDLRGFGDSDKPSGPFGPSDHAADMLALLDALDVRRIGLGVAMSVAPLCSRWRARLLTASPGFSSSISSIQVLGLAWAFPTG